MKGDWRIIVPGSSIRSMEASSLARGATIGRCRLASPLMGTRHSAQLRYPREVLFCDQIGRFSSAAANNRHGSLLAAHIRRLPLLRSQLRLEPS